MPTVADDYSSNVAHLFHGIVDQSGAGIYLVQDRTIRYVNTRFSEFFDTTPQRLIGRTLDDIAPPQQRESLVSHFDKRISGEPLPYFLIQTQLKGKGYRQIELHGNRVEYLGRPAVVGIAIDVTEREETHAELIESRAQLRELMSTIETIQDTERNRIALELHDDIGGLLTALKFDIARIRRRIESLKSDGPATVDADELLELVDGFKEVAQEAISSVRRISEELRPSAIQELGLYDAIRDLVDKFTTRYGLESTLTLPGVASAAEPAAELDLFRMIQEALTNVARHAHATSIAVTLERDADALALSVADNGVGFPAAPDDSRGGLGLVGVRERARRLGGTVQIGNGVDGGARISAWIPWQFRS